VFRKLLNHDGKRYVEEYLMDMDLNWTIVQPGHFMEMMEPSVSGFAASSEPEHVFMASFSPKIRFSCLALQDLSEAVARIIEQREKHYFALYPFVSVETPMSYEETFGVVEKVLGKPVRIQQRSFEEAVSASLKVLSGGGVRVLHRKSAAAAERLLLFYIMREGWWGIQECWRWCWGGRRRAMKAG
jgi:uncharacterized protein YbjT (DUF2867 family)